MNGLSEEAVTKLKTIIDFCIRENIKRGNLEAAHSFLVARDHLDVFTWDGGCILSKRLEEAVDRLIGPEKVVFT